MSSNNVTPAGGQPVWPVAPRGYGDLALPQWNASPGSSSMPDISLASLLRIINEWRWLILGCIAVALAGAIIVTLLTTPLYRATATLELNPPQVEIMDSKKGQPVVQNERTFLATQYGLLRSRALAERVAQQLNLAGNSEFLDIDAD